MGESHPHDSSLSPPGIDADVDGEIEGGAFGFVDAEGGLLHGLASG